MADELGTAVVEETTAADTPPVEETPPSTAAQPEPSLPSYDPSKHSLVNREAFGAWGGDIHKATSDANMGMRLRRLLEQNKITVEDYFNAVEAKKEPEAPQAGGITEDRLKALLAERDAEARAQREQEEFQRTFRDAQQAENSHKEQSLKAAGLTRPAAGKTDREYEAHLALYDNCINMAIREQLSGVQDPNLVNHALSMPANKAALARADSLYKEIAADLDAKAVARAAAKSKDRPGASLDGRGTGGADAPKDRSKMSQKELRDDMIAGLPVPERFK